MSRNPIADHDVAVGKRFKEIVEVCFGIQSFRKLRDEFGLESHSSIPGFYTGSHIDPRAIAAVARAGGDIHYVFTGERSTERAAPACQHGKLCELAPILLDNLAALFRQVCEASPADSAAATECLRGILGSFAAQQSRTIEEQRDAAS